MFTCEGDSAVGQTDDSTAETARFTLAMGEGRENLDIGAITASGVSGSVMAEGAGLGGAVVTLMQGGTVVANAQTAEDGSFAVMELRPGEYSLRVALPEDTLFAENTSLELAHADAQEGQTSTFTLGMGEQATLQTVQTVHTATVAGRAWQDSNADGRMDADEPAMAGVEAELLNENGDTVMKQTVGDDGRYSFKLIRSGVYAVRFTLPAASFLPTGQGRRAARALRRQKAIRRRPSVLRWFQERSGFRSMSERLKPAKSATRSGWTATRTACRITASRCWRAYRLRC